MKTTSPFTYKAAKIMSILGHPLLTISLFVLYITYQQLSFWKATITSGLLLGVVVIPISAYTYRKVEQGQYSNFDVSNQSQRARFYPILISLLTLATLLLFATNQPRPYCYGTADVLLLIISSYGVNHFIKASLHTSLSCFLTCAILLISKPIGLIMGVFTILIAISRLILGRHTLREILAGAFIGFVTGAGLYRILSLI